MTNCALLVGFKFIDSRKKYSDGSVFACVSCSEREEDNP